MDNDKRLKALKQRITSVGTNSKRLDKALSQHKMAIERGDIYLFELENTPEDVAVFWVIIHRHPEDSSIFFTVPADTNSLTGVFDVPIPPTALFGSLVLRLGQGLWLPETMFQTSQRVGLVEILFIDRAQFIMSRIARNEWCGSDMQRATDANPDYEEWMEMIDQVYVAMRRYRENLVLEQAREEAPVKATWLFDNIISLESVKEAIFEYFVAPFLPSASLKYKVSVIGTTRGLATEEGREKSNRYIVGDSFGIRVDIPQDGYLTIFHYTESGTINLEFPILSMDESYLSGGSKKTICFDVKEPFGRHFLKAIWTAKPLIDTSSIDLSHETAKKNMEMKFMERLDQLRKGYCHQMVYEYEVVE